MHLGDHGPARAKRGPGAALSAAARLGRAFPAYEALDSFAIQVERRLAVIREETGRPPTDAEAKKAKAAEARRQRAAVAGFDLVFSPVKSAALPWAVDEREPVRDAIRAAHESALREAPALVEEHGLPGAFRGGQTELNAQLRRSLARGHRARPRTAVISAAVAISGSARFGGQNTLIWRPKFMRLPG